MTTSALGQLAIIPVIVFAVVATPDTARSAGSPQPPAHNFIAGVDFSHVAFFESHGKVYRDGGQLKDPFRILKDHGVNWVRLRLFTSSPEQAKREPYNAINNLEYTLPLAKRVKKAGLRFLLDFHYADSWADPVRQPKPEAWKDLPFDQLEGRMYEYNRDCIAAFKRVGAMPDMVQVGNEITAGMVWPDGRVGGKEQGPDDWVKLGRLMKAAIRGIHAAAGKNMPQIMVHIDRGGDWATTRWFFDHLRDQQVPFDIIGESYYPFWHGSLDDLQTCLTNAAERYGKPVMIAETDFRWMDKEWDGKPSPDVVGIHPGKEGQVQFVDALARVLKAVPEHRGMGIFWWAAEFQPLYGTNLADFDNRSFFDHDGNALPVIEAFGNLARRIE